MRLGTRGSALALAQAHAVAEMLGGDVEIVEVKTSGDTSRPQREAPPPPPSPERPAAPEDKSRWVDGLERALLEERIDLAVHSAKDVPADLAGGLDLLGAPTRENPGDALIGAPSLDALAPGARVGTTSLRRQAALLAIREDIEVVAMRGNVDTRLRKLAEREVDALVLALAGLRRLAASGETRASTALAGGTGPLAATPLPLDRFIPAAGQGCLALEGRTDDETALAAAASITDPSSLVSLRAERALTAALEATCHTPVGAFATSQDDYLSLTAFVGLPDGSAWLRDTLVGDAADPETLGRAVAERLLKAGAGDLLAQAHAMMKP